MKEKKMFMNVFTGSVDSYENWVKTCTVFPKIDDEDNIVYENGTDEVEAGISEKTLIEVVSINGNWVEA